MRNDFNLLDEERLAFWKAYFPWYLDMYIVEGHTEMLLAYPWLSSRIYGRAVNIPH